jgi:hypothetical protein
MIIGPFKQKMSEIGKIHNRPNINIAEKLLSEILPIFFTRVLAGIKSPASPYPAVLTSLQKNN